MKTLKHIAPRVYTSYKLVCLDEGMYCMCKLSPVDEMDNDLLHWKYNEFTPCDCYAYSVQEQDVYKFEADNTALPDEPFNEKEPVYTLHKCKEWVKKRVVIGLPEYVMDRLGKVYRVQHAHMLKAEFAKEQVTTDELRELRAVWDKILKKSFRAERKKARDSQCAPEPVRIEADVVNAGDLRIEITHRKEFPGFDESKIVRGTEAAPNLRRTGTKFRYEPAPEMRHKRGNSHVRFCDMYVRDSNGLLVTI